MVASACFFIPTLIITVCYVIIIGIIWDKSHGLNPGDKKSTKQSNGENQCCTLLVAIFRIMLNNYSIIIKTVSKHSGSSGDHRRHNSSGESKSSSRGVIPQAKVRTIKMTLVIVLGRPSYKYKN